MTSGNRGRHISPCVALALFVNLGACHAWVPIQLGPSADIGDGAMRIRRTNGTVITVVEARLVGDSVVAHLPASSASIAIARSDVQALEARRFSAGRTATLGVALIVLYNVLTYKIGDPWVN
jgi:hypothetical protein